MLPKYAISYPNIANLAECHDIVATATHRQEPQDVHQIYKPLREILNSQGFGGRASAFVMRVSIWASGGFLPNETRIVEARSRSRPSAAA